MFRDEILTYDPIRIDVGKTTRVLRGVDGRLIARFDPSDLNRFRSPSACLNDVCINGGATLLQNILSSSTHPSSEHSRRCAILSTFDLPRIRYNYSDNDLWRNIHRTAYWLKDVWVIPIHRSHPAEHWVLCTASLKTHELFLFDSFGIASQWKHDIQVSCTWFTELPTEPKYRMLCA
jgi:Ulp1 protease family, C-terminal catalytic domain